MTTYINDFDILPYGDSRLRTYTVPDTTVHLSLRIEIAPLLLGLAADFNRTVEHLDPAECYGHAYRKIAGSDKWSFHAPGIAIDLNASKHPLGVSGTFTSAKILAIRKLLTKWSYAGKPLFRWGGDYRTRIDAMHFELIQSRTNCLAAVKLLQAPVLNWTEKLMNTLPILKQNVDNPTFIKTAQGLLTARGFKPDGGIDGVFGYDTKRQTINMQQAAGAEKIDGIWGPETWTIGLTGKDLV